MWSKRLTSATLLAEDHEHGQREALMSVMENPLPLQLKALLGLLVTVVLRATAVFAVHLQRSGFGARRQSPSAAERLRRWDP